ncbi:hypothetical protein ACFRSX_30990 [Streptomyces goshikiensis]|uniref:hypothetical protein n=1 Tax=Streptomyces TaxID=1883 RepID=UPI000C27188C|nr:hypothetical protein [Streptomyces sp. CB02120-2]PJN14638.1 hypothetical protein CG724_33720 [Streptomyces sp. CB02120-2]
MCAYNVEFDRSVILGDIRRAEKKPLHLEPREPWYCLMEAYAAWLGSNRWLRLGGGHRAAGDCLAARDVLIEMSKGGAASSLRSRRPRAIPSPERLRITRSRPRQPPDAPFPTPS